MAADTVTRVTYRQNPNFFQRVGGSLIGAFIGILLLFGGCTLLFWNEGRAVYKQQSLDEGIRLVKELALSGETASLGHDDVEAPLVHLTGPLFTPMDLEDSYFGVRVRAVSLKRKVQMYQWVEHRETREYNEGGQTREETRFSYTKEWKSELIDSRGFENFRDNPREFPVPSKHFQSHLVKVRGLILSNVLVEKIDNYKQLHVETFPDNFRRHDDFLCNSRDPYNPKIGDVRMKFEAAGMSSKTGADKVSIVARKDSDRLSAYQTTDGNEIEFLYMGELSAKRIFEKEVLSNMMMTWGIRLGGWLLLFIALGAMTGPVRVLVDWLPIVRELVSLGLGTLNFFISSSLAVFIIALGWIRYRPLLGWSLVMIAASPYVVAWLRRARGLSSRHRD